jgi:hypothetical protein
MAPSRGPFRVTHCSSSTGRKATSTTGSTASVTGREYELRSDAKLPLWPEAHRELGASAFLLGIGLVLIARAPQT